LPSGYPFGPQLSFGAHNLQWNHAFVTNPLHRPEPGFIRKRPSQLELRCRHRSVARPASSVGMLRIGARVGMLRRCDRARKKTVHGSFGDWFGWLQVAQFRAG
jgi:hypothetical protein